MYLVIRIILLMTGLLFSQTASSQMFVGYDSFCGLPVVVGNDPQRATARKDQFGNKFIHVAPSVMANWSASRIFVFAHECAHHLLGHTNSLGELERFYWGTRRQELKADCWAANVLTDAEYDFDITRTILEQANQGHFISGDYPSGSKRAQNIANCASGGQTCELIEFSEEYTVMEWVTESMQISCQHCGCDSYG